ncbi:alpha-L-fucosidase 1 [Melioribacter roseus P3M-2]|uniref:alpha-L-fucosidase n=1 Tax=Melioribacter roseus (strain DSM 23840 / JCM 17771 / VKM B-2668 / P3M-2) TaxID=1191523 RepID=I6ZRY6_MELRP|nr:alpha-L-fucosidase [Melioribacter roseus]AFN74824.1 alpha-L-fucosidase 1 [Melioribacter roseus P3M-2]
MTKKFLFAFLCPLIVFSQTKSNIVFIDPDDTPAEIIRKAANVIPAWRQYDWQKLELTAFIHFGMNTFMNLEWGRKDFDLSVFNPSGIDTDQWARILKEAGFKLIILTAKHHDGFCLWPSRYTDYDIENTPYKNGKGDIVKELSESCRKEGIKFGIYLSPWDMHEKTYGSDAYNEYFRNQLKELLTNYGEIAEVWFDGACGEGPSGKKQIYDWNSYYELIRELQPDCIIANMGPDVRWVGTESGYGRKTEWSVLPGNIMDTELIAASSQQKRLDNAFIPRDLTEEDLGSREKILKAKSLIWYPAEIDVSIRPRWFYHKEDDNFVKSPEKLFDIYLNSVGLNGVLLLNVPPNKDGLIVDQDIKSLIGFKYLIENTFGRNLATGKVTFVSSEREGNSAALILDNDYETYWTTYGSDSTAVIEISLDTIRTFNCAMLQENILEGQRIEKFSLEFWRHNQWKKFATGTTIGYKRLFKFDPVTTSRVRIIIEQCRTNPTLSSFGLYITPPSLSFSPGDTTFRDTLAIKINCDIPDSKIYYTLDGSLPDSNSTLYDGEIIIDSSTTITAVAFSGDGKKGLPVSVDYYKAKYEIISLTKYSQAYSGGGKYALVNGVRGSSYFKDGNWQGYHGNDLVAVLDLKEYKRIRKISAGFLKDINAYIFFPDSVTFYTSEDGINFNKLGSKKTVDTNENNAEIQSVSINANGINCRYIKIEAKNIGVCPEWHVGKGAKAWLFADEITVE